MSLFADMIEYMSQTDIIHLFFPWVLVVAVTYGALDKYEIFDDPTVNGAISLAFSFLSMGGIYFFTPQGLFVNFGAALAFATFVALGFMIVMAVAGIEIDDMTDQEKSIPLAGGLLILGLGLIFGVLDVLNLGIAQNPPPLSDLVSLLQDVAPPVLLIGFVLAVIYITSKSSEE